MEDHKKPLFVYNSMSRSRELFTSITPGIVGMYSCGPTVYNFPHIGNYRAYISQDIVARTLSYNGYAVTHVMNITDVDDKTIRDSRAAHKSLTDFTNTYTGAFLQDLSDLNISTITYHPKATMHIQEMIDIIQTLLSSGIAYTSDDGSVYFSIRHFSNYGKLSHIEKSQLQSDASGRVRNDEYSKDDVQDFALWKAWTEADGDVGWDSPFGKGRPGWHIECSAMSMKYLGNHFDIHSGGIDLLFPHHENEIAQSEAATKESFVNYWLHNEWLLVNGKKMSKSLGNFYTLRDVLAKGYEPLAYRFFCLSAHYRQSLNFTFEALDAAQQGYKNLYADISRIAEFAASDASTSLSTELRAYVDVSRDLFLTAINDDFNSPKALAQLFDFIKYIHLNEKSFTPNDYQLCLTTLFDWDDVLGLKLSEIRSMALPAEIQVLANERQQARAMQNWSRADELRKHIEAKGYAIEDTQHGPRVSKV